MAAFPNCHATTAISASEPATTPSSMALAMGDLRVRGKNEAAQTDEEERRREDAERCHGCSERSGDEIADERGCREERSGGDLSYRNGVEQLLFRQPTQAAHEIGAEKCQ